MGVHCRVLVGEEFLPATIRYVGDASVVVTLSPASLPPLHQQSQTENTNSDRIRVFAHDEIYTP